MDMFYSVDEGSTVRRIVCYIYIAKKTSGDVT